LSKNNLNDDLIFSDDTSSTILVQDSSKLIKKGYIRKKDWIDTSKELIDYKRTSDGESWYLLK
jgi:hypothetical protein